MTYLAPPYPEWSWSLSRDQMFHACKRQYYFHYYASHGGWLLTSNEEAKTAYRLKQLKNLYLAFGEAVHQAAQDLLQLREQQGSYPEPGSIAAYLRRMMNDTYKSSKNLDEWWVRPRQSGMLHEIYYEGGLPPTRTATISERIAACAENLLQSESWKELCNEPEAKLLEVEKLSYFTLHEDKLYVKLDALYRRDDGMWVIVDWKTGRKDEKNKEQMALYALYVHECYGVPLDHIEVRTEYLLAGRCERVVLPEEELIHLKRKIAYSLDSMKTYLADDYYNRPLPVEKFLPAADRTVCRWCSFQQLCPEKQLEEV
ncbi:PD-(D/E)XK nuclease family protein [Aneurinibacillus tyrosinisolvens]|uniref:PD-(D/E)XK nuclease family protein n=1 Tax=Aneurinibacillus tyrosinisolvens TaxID=1443435 RepID=UPI00063F9BFF|nr:PD-(D/E)XK nuclease family protein [Aneurinibacillus tyrosinisolvens]